MVILVAFLRNYNNVLRIMLKTRNEVMGCVILSLKNIEKIILLWYIIKKGENYL